MARTARKGAEEARNQLPDLLEAVTKHGRPVAAIVPLDTYEAGSRQQPLTPMQGSGRGLWGEDSGRMLRELRDEWSR